MSPGDVIDDRFAIEGAVASGGMGDVYRAKDLHTGQIIALKLLRGHVGERPVRFQREVDALLTLQHPTIVRYVANGVTAAGSPYLAMEWLDGQTLGERLTTGPLGVADSIEAGLGIAVALAEVHARGFIHRDLKPSNVFLMDGSVSAVKLIDFGLARPSLARGELTAPGIVLGTIGYLAPEQARGDPQVDARADIFSLGCILFRCVTGKRPFAGDDDLSVLLKIIVEEPLRMRELSGSTPAALDDLVARMLSKSPAARPADGAAVAAALSALGTAGPGSSHSRRGGQPRPELTARERRVMSLVLTRDPALDARSSRPDDSGEPPRTARPLLQAPDRLHSTVERHRGNLEQLADGSSLVVFTSDGEATDLCARAARCALSIRAMSRAAPIVVVSGRAELSGRKLVGELIDRAVGLLQAAGSPGVRIDDVTAGLLGPGFAVSGGWLTGVREVLDAPAPPSASRPPPPAPFAPGMLLGKPTAFAGRDHEIAAIEGAYARCADEPAASVVLCTGAPGMGKSRLGSELLARLRRLPVPPQIWIGRGDPMSAGSAFGMAGQAIRRALGLAEGMPLKDRRERLRARIAQREPRPAEAERVAQFVGELTGTPFPNDAGSAGVQLRAARRDPVLLGDQMRRAFEDLVRTQCSTQPLVLVLEDVQWGDLPTVKLVDAALRRLHDRPFMVLAFARPEVHQVFPNLWSGRRLEEIRLSRLPRRAAEQLVRAALGSDAAADLVDDLIERAEGNALYLEELIRAVVEGKGGALPETVLAMVQARLEALGGEERRALRAASVFGQAFREDGVAALLGGADVRILLRTLAEQEVIVETAEETPAGPEGYRFRHAVLREAAYGMLTEADRVLGHKLAAEHLGEAGESDAVVLAEHLEWGGDPASAAGFYRRAAEQAFEGNDLEAALGRAESGLRCVDDPGSALAGELHLLRAKVCRWAAGKNREAEQAASLAMRLLPRGSARWCEAAAEVVYVSGKLGDADRLLSATEALLGLTGALDGESAASYAIALARAATTLQLSAGRQALVEVVLDRADGAAALSAGDPEVAGQVEWARSLRVLSAGDVSTFLALVKSSHEHLELAGDLRSDCIQALNAGHGYLQLGAYEEAERILGEAMEGADRMGLANARTFAKLNLGLALLGQGRVGEARAVEEDALALLRAQADRPSEASAQVYLAMCLARAGDLEGAGREALAVALAGAGEGPTPSHRACARAILADVRLAQGFAESALAEAEAAMSILTSLDGIEEGEAHIRVVYADALAAAGHADAARKAAAEAGERLLARAAKVVDPGLRASFLERVPENARTLARARMA
jgi:eukaryotic-like serine/threonine-protein kinase